MYFFIWTNVVQRLSYAVKYRKYEIGNIERNIPTDDDKSYWNIVSKILDISISCIDIFDKSMYGWHPWARGSRVL